MRGKNTIFILLFVILLLVSFLAYHNIPSRKAGSQTVVTDETSVTTHLDKNEATEEFAEEYMEAELQQEKIKEYGNIYKQGEIVSFGFLEYKVNEMIVLSDIRNYEDEIPDYDESGLIAYKFEDNEWIDNPDGYSDRIEELCGCRYLSVYISLDIKNLGEKKEIYAVPSIVMAEDYIMAGSGSTIYYITGTDWPAEDKNCSYVVLEKGETRTINIVYSVQYSVNDAFIDVTNFIAVRDIRNVDWYVDISGQYTSVATNPINEDKNHIYIECEPVFKEKQE